jgi:hypothetical protein
MALEDEKENENDRWSGPAGDNEKKLVWPKLKQI